MIFHLTTAALAYNNGAPHSKLPPLGWSSWVALGPDADKDEAKALIFDFCDEASVMASIDAYVTDAVGLYKAGYRHFHLDDCWADKERNATGFLQGERDHFPNGMKKIVDYAHSKGLTFGLYTCAGTHTCVGGRPGSKDHFPQDAAVFAEWGVDVVKMDCAPPPARNLHTIQEASERALRPLHSFTPPPSRPLYSARARSDASCIVWQGATTAICSQPRRTP